MLKSLLTSEHWYQKPTVEQSASVEHGGPAHSVNERSQSAAQMPDPPAQGDAKTVKAKKPKVESTEKAVGLPLIGVGAGFVLLGSAPPVGAVVLAASAVWLFYQSL